MHTVLVFAFTLHQIINLIMELSSLAINKQFSYSPYTEELSSFYGK